jgi:hypothetical protein
LHGLGGARRDVLILDEIGRAPAVLDGGDVGGQVRVGAGSVTSAAAVPNVA